MNAFSDHETKPIPLDEQRERDSLLKRLLKTPPQPRPKRERKPTPAKKGGATKKPGK